MRITNKTMHNTFINNLNNNLQRMQKAQEQLTSGKLVSRPSDNPLLVGKILSMTENIHQNEQYNSNIGATQGWVQTQDGALDGVNKTMNRIRDLIVYGANGAALSDTDRNAIRIEMQTKVGELQDMLNTNYDGRYIFAGQATDKPPFDSELTYTGSETNIEREISQGVTIEIIADGSKITTLDNGSTLGQFLDKVITSLGEPGGTDDLSNKFLAEADEFIDNILRVRSQVGAIDNRLEAAEERNKSENLNLKGVLSSKEDIDIAEKYMEYVMMSTNYQASLSVGAKILQPSLLDYLR